MQKLEGSLLSGYSQVSHVVSFTHVLQLSLHPLF